MIQTDQQNVPKLRFPEFEGVWEENALGEIAEIYQPQTLSQSQLDSDGQFLVYGANGVIGRLDRYNHEQSQVAVTCRGNTCGQVTFTEPRSWITGNSMVINLDASERAEKRFVYFKLVATDWTYLITGSGQPQITGSIKKHKLPLPALPEQRKIASFLSAVDTKISQLARKKALFEDYKKGCMQQLFSQEIRFKDDEGRDFPDWEEKRLQQLANRVKEKNTEKTVVDVLTNSAVQGIINQGDYFDHDVANAENLDRYTIVQIGDFVYNPRISTSAPVGPIKRNLLRQGVMSPLYDVFRFTPSENLDFWEHYFSATVWYKYMKQVANYGARHDRMAISSGDFFKMPLPYPHPDEQRKIADFLSTLDRKIELVSAELEHAKTFKKGLLQQMFV